MAMRISEEKKYTVSELIAGFIEDNETNQVTSMNGRLNVRPAYQRLFVWDNEKNGGPKQQALIDSILHKYPINVMYFVKTGKNDAGEDMYEVLDGQQRIITMAHYWDNMFSLADGTLRSGLRDTSKFLDYNMFTVYVCEADDFDEKMMWFRRINTSGESLSDQEMRSALASGLGTTQAKKYFVNTRQNNGTNAYSYDIQSGRPARDYISKNWIRQDVYEQVITWKIGSKKDADILSYMKNNRESTEAADELFKYFQNVIKWVKRLFPTYHKEMAGVEWGILYNKYHDNTSLSSSVLEEQVNYLRSDVGTGDSDHLKNYSGIYEYVLAIANGISERDAIKLLQPRTFAEKDKIKQYEKQQHVCPHCMQRFENITWMDGDHIIPYSPIPASGQENGKTTPDNLQMLCHSCNLEKRNHPFNKKEELKKLKLIYELTPAAVAALPEGSSNG